ncbi:hypothetical protein BDV34DRAFT_195808 [Aspergillus parasiticus]|uniref:Uncharacterized protein n=1 Tax=Aspergillus parasiticus TaxID=5067 RepID=A0A5N6DJR5_ASPPA|nr:hypothetical protein BDV34DRAFT_195808 [Aspergillus parasiticus]
MVSVDIFIFSNCPDEFHFIASISILFYLAFIVFTGRLFSLVLSALFSEIRQYPSYNSSPGIYLNLEPLSWISLSF